VRIGIDVGGTFTDVVIVEEGGAQLAFKSPSNPTDPEAGVLAGLELAARRMGLDRPTLLRRCEIFVHGSTIATNILLERKGARVGLLTTKGFRDWLEIRRGLRPDPWNHREPFPAALVPRSLRLAVDERLDQTGAIVSALDEASVREAAAKFRAAGVESVAVCLLHAYRNPVHERRVAELLAPELPTIPVSLSSTVAPVLGEYERGSTAVVNAYVAPRVVPYLRALETRLGSEGLRPRILLIQSNGGAATVEEIAERPVQLVLSGPAAGIGALRYFASDSGAENVISIEIGGTSCDVTLARSGDVATTDLLDVDGFAVLTPAVEIHTVGAGGGTIARVDAAGLLRAGPEGAGARPGPACYGLGGDHPTVTDCQLVLGRLKPGPYAGGAISLDLARAVDAIRTKVASPLGIGVEEAAAGILRLVEQTIQHAVERVSIERGYDPRGFTLVACGGAGPLHGPPTARRLGCRDLYVPRLAGVFCAFGMCNADIRQDHVRSWLAEIDDPADAGLGRLRSAVAEMRSAASERLERQGFAPDRIAVLVSLDMRYAGQQSPICVAVDRLDRDCLIATFEREHLRLYGHLQPSGSVEIVNLRVTGIGHLPPLATPEAGGATLLAEPIAMRQVWLDAERGWTETPVYAGDEMRPGHILEGPAVIEEGTTTILLGADDRLRVTPGNNYSITAAEPRR
jgi:N-methylhydantoinase A